MRISDWSSDVFSSDLLRGKLEEMRAGRDEDERGEHDGDEPDRPARHAQSPLLPGLPKTSGRKLSHAKEGEIGGFPAPPRIAFRRRLAYLEELGRATCRDRVWQYL